jgi:hypothetical protein
MKKFWIYAHGLFDRCQMAQASNVYTAVNECLKDKEMFDYPLTIFEVGSDLICSNDILPKEPRQIVDFLFAEHDFGDMVIEHADGWVSSGAVWTRMLYVKTLVDGRSESQTLKYFFKIRLGNICRPEVIVEPAF